MRRITLLLVSFIVCLFTTGQVLALIIIDVDLTDQNSITGYNTIPDLYGSGIPALFVNEDYNEDHLVGYPSHDGMGIVNDHGGFFDKIVTFDANDLGLYSGGGSPWVFLFNVKNTSPYVWSDYHFEFWDATFTNRLNNPGLLWGAQSEIFTNFSFDGTELQFWAPGWQSPGETYEHAFGIFLDEINGGQPDSFGLRQVATTTPEPGTLLLLGSGLAGPKS